MFKSNPLKKATKHASRVGTDSVKVLFTIEVEKVVFTDEKTIKSITNGSLLSVCFERGGKLASSADQKVQFPAGPGPKVLPIGESLSLVATLYRDQKSGTFQEKKGKIILRELTRSRLGGEVYKGLGSIKLPLHLLLADLVTGSKTSTYNFAELKGASTVVKISARYGNLV